MTSCCPPPRMPWNGATGAIARCKRVCIGCGHKSRSGRVWRWICGVKLTPKAVNKPSPHSIVHGLDKPGVFTTVSYFRGEMFTMAGASPTHVLIVTNIVGALHGQLRRRPCTVYATDLRLKVNASGLYTYPDIAVVCGEPQFDDDQRDTLINPTLIVKVLSESTQDYDR